MYLIELMKKRELTRAELVRQSGIPESTLRDILNGSANIEHCQAGTLSRISKALETTVEDILDHCTKDSENSKTEADRKTVHEEFSTVYFYKAFEDTKNALRDKGDRNVAWAILRNRKVETFYAQGFYRTALFLVGLMDYLYRRHGAAPDPYYDQFRKMKLDAPVYSLDTLEKDDSCAQIKAKANA